MQTTSTTYAASPSASLPGTWDVLRPDGSVIETRHDTAGKARRAATIYHLQAVALAAAAEPGPVPVIVTGRRLGDTRHRLPESLYVPAADAMRRVNPAGFVHVGDWDTDWTPREDVHSYGYVVGIPVVGYAPDGRIVFERLLGHERYDREARNSIGGLGAFVTRPPSDDELRAAIQEARRLAELYRQEHPNA